MCKSATSGKSSRRTPKPRAHTTIGPHAPLQDFFNYGIDFQGLTENEPNCSKKNSSTASGSSARSHLVKDSDFSVLGAENESHNQIATHAGLCTRQWMRWHACEQ
jgi:hypothetical protein